MKGGRRSCREEFQSRLERGWGAKRVGWGLGVEAY